MYGTYCYEIQSTINLLSKDLQRIKRKLIHKILLRHLFPINEEKNLLKKAKNIHKKRQIHFFLQENLSFSHLGYFNIRSSLLKIRKWKLYKCSRKEVFKYSYKNIWHFLTWPFNNKLVSILSSFWKKNVCICVSN